MPYRPEIDGLRALCIIPIIIYHLNPALVPAGFLGVDIFFVISGFLITNIIKKDLSENTFCIFNFIKRRLKRLYPALAFLIFVCLITGFLIYHAHDFQSLGSQSLATLFSLANIKMWSLSGYWSLDSDHLALLHTWSLGIEEQFYLLFALFAITLFKIRPKSIHKTAVILFICSFASSLYCSAFFPDFQFYMLPTRAWELLAGVILALKGEAEKKKNHALYTDVSILLLCFSFFFFHPKISPELTLLFVIAPSLTFLHYSHNSSSISSNLLSSKAICYIGKLSYSLYLWHWPVIVFYKHHLYPTSLSLQDSLLVSLMFCSLAIFSYYTIEKKFRKQSFSQVKHSIYISFFILSTLSLLISLQIIKPIHKGTYKSTINYYPHNFIHPKTKTGPYQPIPSDEELDILVIGSSHAQMYYFTLHEIAKELNLNIAYYAFKARSGRVLKEDDSNYNELKSLDKQRLQWIAQSKPRIIIYGEFYASEYVTNPTKFKDSYIHTFAILLQHCQHIITMEQAPYPGKLKNLDKYLNKAIGNELTIYESLDDKETRKHANQSILELATSKFKRQLHFIETEDLFLKSDLSVKVANKDNYTLYRDNHHLSPQGTSLVKQRIKDQISQILSAP